MTTTTTRKRRRKRKSRRRKRTTTLGRVVASHPGDILIAHPLSFQFRGAASCVSRLTFSCRPGITADASATEKFRNRSDQQDSQVLAPRGLISINCGATTTTATATTTTTTARRRRTRGVLRDASSARRTRICAGIFSWDSETSVFYTAEAMRLTRRVRARKSATVCRRAVFEKVTRTLSFENFPSLLLLNNDLLPCTPMGDHALISCMVKWSLLHNMKEQAVETGIDRLQSTMIDPIPIVCTFILYGRLKVPMKWAMWYLTRDILVVSGALNMNIFKLAYKKELYMYM